MSHRRANWIIAALLLAQALFGIHSAVVLSVTHDEYWHLPAGLLAIPKGLGKHTGLYDNDDLNPPLTRMWSALPLLFMNAKAEGDRDIGKMGDKFLELNRENYHTLFVLARCFNVVWATLTGVILAAWGRQLFGEWAAVLTVALWATCPTVVGHASLVTPDMGAACLFTATLYFAWRFAKQPTWTRAAILGLCLGLAQVAKFTNVLLFLFVPVVWILVKLQDRRVPTATADLPPDQGKNRNRVTFVSGRDGLFWKLVAIAGICLFAINAGYLFYGTGSTLRHMTLKSRALQPLANLPGFFRHIPIPLSTTYIEGIDHQRVMMEGDHPVYLDGEWSIQGFLDYPLWTLVYKLPHATQVLLVLAIAFNLWPGGVRANWLEQLLLWLPVLVLGAMAAATSMQLGFRYLLPAIPCLHLLAGQCGRWFDWPQYRLRTLLIGAAALALPLSLRYAPHHIAYFNECAGGPIGGRYHLLDSNLDWGQDLRGLKSWLDRHPEATPLGLAYFGMVPPSVVGIEYTIPPRQPTPGWYAVSANFVMGRPHTIRLPSRELRSADFNEFGWFRFFEPVDRIGYSIDIYHITAEDIRRGGSRAVVK